MSVIEAAILALCALRSAERSNVPGDVERARSDALRALDALPVGMDGMHFVRVLVVAYALRYGERVNDVDIDDAIGVLSDMVYAERCQASQRDNLPTLPSPPSAEMARTTGEDPRSGEVSLVSMARPLVDLAGRPFCPMA